MGDVAVPVDVGCRTTKPDDCVEIGGVRGENHDRRAARRELLQSCSREEQADERVGQIVQLRSLARYAEAWPLRNAGLEF